MVGLQPARPTPSGVRPLGALPSFGGSSSYRSELVPLGEPSGPHSLGPGIVRPAFPGAGTPTRRILAEGRGQVGGPGENGGQTNGTGAGRGRTGRGPALGRDPIRTRRR